MRLLPAALLLVVFAAGARAEVELIARALVPGTARDRSGLQHRLENGVPADRLGFGSAIAYTGRGARFIALSDRGPNARPYDARVDNTTSFIVRFHVFDLRLRPSGTGTAPAYALRPRLLATTLLASRPPLAYGAAARPGKRAHFIGRSDAFEPGRGSHWPGHARLDPEGVRVASDGASLFVADEYGPALYRFDRRSGTRTATYALPGYYAVAEPDASGRRENSANARGRVANRSLEGLAITPEGRTLVGILQSPLLQDGGVGALDTRIVAVDLATGARREHVYRLEAAQNMASEIVAVNAREFLVVERDGLEGEKAAFKRIYRIDLSAAHDVHGMEKLPASGVKAVAKALFIDLLEPRHGLAGKGFPARIEGLAFGPDLVRAGRRRHTLYVTSDNDYLEEEASAILVFAIDARDLAGFEPQRFRR